MTGRIRGLAVRRGIRAVTALLLASSTVLLAAGTMPALTLCGKPRNTMSHPAAAAAGDRASNFRSVRPASGR